MIRERQARNQHGHPRAARCSTWNLRSPVASRFTWNNVVGRHSSQTFLPVVSRAPVRQSRAFGSQCSLYLATRRC
jgi:hypothetical protein